MKKKRVFRAVLSMILTLAMVMNFFIVPQKVSAEDLYKDPTTGLLFDLNTCSIIAYTGNETDLVIPQTINGIEVKSIANNAFWNKNILTSVTLPSSVTLIGQGAFQGCSKLANISMPNGVTTIYPSAFLGCSGLTSLTIPDSVTTIGDSAFKECTSLTSINIPSSVISIGSNVFEGCTGLTSVVDQSNLTSISNYMFKDCTSLKSVNIPSTVTNIGAYAFEGCSKLTDIQFPTNLTSIDTSAFQDCSGLTSLQIPNNVTTIGSSAFYGCTQLTNVVLPNKLTLIGESAFRDCVALTSMTIPSSVAEIDELAFDNCSKLTAINVDASNSYYSSNNGVLFSKDGKILIQCPANSSFTSYEISNKVETIEVLAFNGCVKLKSITIPNSVTLIRDYAFNNCINLEVLTIPKSVTSMSYSTFANCQKLSAVNVDPSNPTYRSTDGVVYVKLSGSILVFPINSTISSFTLPGTQKAVGMNIFAGHKRLKEVTISYGVKQINENAFKDCTGLTKVIISDSVTFIDNSAFDGCSSELTIYGGTDSVAIQFANSKGINYKETSIIQFNSNGGSPINDLIAETGSLVNAPTSPTLLGSYFIGWYTDLYNGVKVTFPFNANQNCELYAQWAPIKTPSSLKVQLKNSSTASISWSSVSDPTCSFEIWRSVSAKSGFTKVGTTKNKTFLNSGLKPGPTYYYKVRVIQKAENSVFYSPYSSVGSIKTIVAKPTSLVVKKTSSTSIKASWSAIANVSGYEVYYAKSANGKYTKVYSGKTNTCVKKGLLKGGKYYFKVRTYVNVNGVNFYSGYTDIKSIKL